MGRDVFVGVVSESRADQHMHVGEIDLCLASFTDIIVRQKNLPESRETDTQVYRGRASIDR